MRRGDNKHLSCVGFALSIATATAPPHALLHRLSSQRLTSQSPSRLSAPPACLPGATVAATGTPVDIVVAFGFLALCQAPPSLCIASTPPRMVPTAAQADSRGHDQASNRTAAYAKRSY